MKKFNSIRVGSGVSLPQPAPLPIAVSPLCFLVMIFSIRSTSEVVFNAKTINKSSKLMVMHPPRTSVSVWAPGPLSIQRK